MKTVLLVFGTRPEAIKMCPLVREFRTCEDIKTVVCVTGQHRELLEGVLRTFDVTADYDLAVMREGRGLTGITSAILEGLDGVLDEVGPELVLVHGDTTTAFASSLACFYRGIAVGHVEAGLRTYDMASPFPEEFNRQAIGLTASLHFAPTEAARDNLLREGKDGSRIFVTGNTGLDALRYTVRSDFRHPYLDISEGSRLIVLTAHRRENLGETMRGMLRAVRRAAEVHPDVKVIYPVHPNPRVREAAVELCGCERIILTEPMDVANFHNLLSRSYLIISDSGGIQEEAAYLGKPMLVMRDTTERAEGLSSGNLRLVGTDEKSIYEGICRLLSDGELYSSMSRPSFVFGGGWASKRIVENCKLKLKI